MKVMLVVILGALACAHSMDWDNSMQYNEDVLAIDQELDQAMPDTLPHEPTSDEEWEKAYMERYDVQDHYVSPYAGVEGAPVHPEDERRRRSRRRRRNSLSRKQRPQQKRSRPLDYEDGLTEEEFKLLEEFSSAEN